MIPDYPTADYLRSVTYEGRAKNHGLEYNLGLWTNRTIAKLLARAWSSEASNAIIAAVDKS
jgi:hypothetical protein